MSTSVVDIDSVCEHLKVCKLDTGKISADEEELFKQPPPPLGDCPICFLRLPMLYTACIYKTCCGKLICSGCSHAPLYNNQGNKVAEKTCPFCRTPKPKSTKEALERSKKRIEAGDPIAIFNQGNYYREGVYGYPQDYTKALELYQHGAELGYAKAYTNIGYSYNNGKGVEVDKKKARYYYEQAAIRGDETARHNLGINEEKAGDFDRALKHWMIAARDGHTGSLNKIQKSYSDEHAIKDDYTKALRSYQEYLSEIKSTQRDEAAAYNSEYYRYY